MQHQRSNNAAHQPPLSPSNGPTSHIDLDGSGSRVDHTNVGDGGGGGGNFVSYGNSVRGGTNDINEAAFQTTSSDVQHLVPDSQKMLHIPLHEDALSLQSMQPSSSPQQSHVPDAAEGINSDNSHDSHQTGLGGIHQGVVEDCALGNTTANIAKRKETVEEFIQSPKRRLYTLNNSGNDGGINSFVNLNVENSFQSTALPSVPLSTKVSAMIGSLPSTGRHVDFGDKKDGNTGMKWNNDWEILSTVTSNRRRFHQEIDTSRTPEMASPPTDRYSAPAYPANPYSISSAAQQGSLYIGVTALSNQVGKAGALSENYDNPWSSMPKSAILQSSSSNYPRDGTFSAKDIGASNAEIDAFFRQRVVVDEDDELTDEDSKVIGPDNDPGTFDTEEFYAQYSARLKDEGNGFNKGNFSYAQRGMETSKVNNNVVGQLDKIMLANQQGPVQHVTEGQYRALQDNLGGSNLFQNPKTNSIGTSSLNQNNYLGSLRIPPSYAGKVPFADIYKVVIGYLNNPQHRTYRLFAQQPLLAQKSYGEERRFFLPPQLRLYGFTRTAQASINICGKSVQGIVEKGFVSWKRMYIPSNIEDKDVSVSYTVINSNISYTLPAPPISKLSKPSKKKQSPPIPAGDLVAFFLRTRNSQHFLTADGPTSTGYWDSFIVEGEFCYGEVVRLQNRKGCRVVTLRPVLGGKAVGDRIAPLGKVLLEGVDEPIRSEITRVNGERWVTTTALTAGVWTVVPVVTTSVTFHVPSAQRQEILLPRITHMEAAGKYLIIHGVEFPPDLWVFMDGTPMLTVERFEDFVRCWTSVAYRGRIHLATYNLLIDCGVISD